MYKITFVFLLLVVHISGNQCDGGYFWRSKFECPAEELTQLEQRRQIAIKELFLKQCLKLVLAHYPDSNCFLCSNNAISCFPVQMDVSAFE